MKQVTLKLKFILILLLLFTSSCYSWAQDGEMIHQIDNEYYKQVDPEAWRFHQYSFSNLDHNTGTADIAIPIYTIKIGRITVPINIVYNTLGIKVEDHVSYVGVGWDLIAGGRITRKVMGGLPDLKEYVKSFPEEKILGYQKKGSYEYDSRYFIDQAPDLFYYSGPGVNGSFLFNKYGDYHNLNDKNTSITFQIQDNIEIPLSIENNPVSPIEDYVAFSIIKDGMKYSFNNYELGATAGSNWTLEKTVGSWLLTEIEDLLGGDKVTFEYSEMSGSSDQNFINERVRPSVGCGCSGTDTYSTTSIIMKQKRLSRIHWSEGEVNFSYDFNRLDAKNTSDNALTSIEVKNNDNRIIKDFEFDYSHFISAGTNTYEYYRLKLDKITEWNSNHSESKEIELEYFPGNLPSKISKEQDLWGYYNDNNASSLMPKLYFYPSMAYGFGTEKASICFFPERLLNEQSSYYVINGADRSVNSSSILHGMLKTIKFPSGGYREFGYEPNVISVANDEIEGGGLRLAFERLSDTDQSYTKLYNYHYGKVLAIPQMAHMCDANTFAAMGNGSARSVYIDEHLQVFSYSFLSSFDLNPYQVCYNKVVESEPQNGRIAFSFNPISTNSSFLNWDVEAGVDCGSIHVLYSNKHFNLPPRSALSGKPSLIEYYKEGALNGDPIKKIQYFYDTFSNTLFSENLKTKIGIMDYSYYIDNIDYEYEMSKIRTKIETIDGVDNQVDYWYDTENGLLKSVSKPIGDGWEEVVSYTYPSDVLFDSQEPFSTNDTIYLAMEALETKKAMIPFFSKKLLVHEDSQTAWMTDLSMTLYKNYGDLTLPCISYSGNIPDNRTSYSLSFNSSGILNALSSNLFLSQNEIFDYDYGKPSLIYNNQTKSYTFLQWNNDDLSMPYLVASNSKPEDVHYESFESEGSYPGEQVNGLIVNGGVFGSKCLEPYQGFVWAYKPTGFDPNKVYRVSFWATGQGISNICNGHSIEINSLNKWEYYSITFTGESALQIGFDMQGAIDELRILPVDGQMLARTFTPLVGVTSETNVNGVSNYYEYDNFGRLSIIKNSDDELVSSYTYNYAGLMSGDVSSFTEISNTSLNFRDEEETLFVEVRSNDNWTITDNASWITVSPTSGQHNGRVYITCTQNGTTNDRPGNVTINGKVISILQERADIAAYLNLTAYNLNFISDYETKNVNISSNVTWTTSSNQYWLRVLPPDSGGNEGTIAIQCDPNVKTISRSGEITVSGGGIVKTINVVQDAGGPGFPK